MTLEEALATIDGDGPLVEFSAQQKAVPDVVAALDSADVASDPAQLTRVRRLLGKASNYLIQNALTDCWVRAELTLGNYTAIAEAIFASTYPARFIDAARAVGPPAWPLARLLLERRPPRWSVTDKLIELSSALIAPHVPGCEPRFAELCSLSTSIAARALSNLRWSAKIPIAGRLGALVPEIDTPEGGDVVDALRAAAVCGESLAAIEPLIDDAVLSGPRAEDVAYALTLSSVHNRTTARCIGDPRPPVRIGVVRALANDPRLVAFARDSDAAVRRAAIAALGKRTVAADEIVALVSALEIAGAELANLLVVAVDEASLLAACDADGSRVAHVLAASLRRQHGRPTRACATCKQLRRSASWSSSSDTPSALGALTVVRQKGGEEDWRLLRCPKCSACYVVTYSCEYDVTENREAWSQQRLTLTEIKRDYGADFVADWSAALVADLDHPDPHWRTEAANEIARELVATRQFERLEGELLRHASREVPREALRILREQAVDAPVSTAVLELLAASTDDETRTNAATLLAVQQGSRALDDLHLDSDAELARAELLLRRGVAGSSSFVSRVLDQALAATSSTWHIDSVVEQAAFTSEHLPATLARLRTALDVPTTRRRALQLAEKLAKQSLLDEETRVIALRQGDTELEATLNVALAEPRSLPPALANAALRAGYSNSVVRRLTDSLTRDEDLRWAIPALGASVLSQPENYDSAPLLDELAKRGVDLTDAVHDLTTALDSAVGYSAQYAAYALIRHHIRRGETDAAIALLSHPVPSIRGAAASVLEDKGIALPAAIIARLQEMTTEPAWYPRGSAERALRVRVVGN